MYPAAHYFMLVRMQYSHRLIDLVLLAGNIVLLAVFALAALAKLGDTERAREGLAAFGVPQRASRMALAGLVGVELLLAALLAYAPTRQAGAWAALGVLAVFTCAIGWQLLHGRRPACACLGALSRSAIGWKSIVRNVALMALAGGLIMFPGATTKPPAGMPLPTSLVLLWAVTSMVWLLLLTRQNGRLLLRIQQLEQLRPAGGDLPPAAANAGPLSVGAAVPPLGLSDSRGRPFDLRSVRGTPVLLLFLDSACAHCRPLLAQLREQQPAGVELAVISEHAALRHELPSGIRVLVDPSRTAASLFGVRGTPAAVLVDSGGALAQLPVHGAPAVRSALEQHTGEVRHEWAPV